MRTVSDSDLVVAALDVGEHAFPLDRVARLLAARRALVAVQNRVAHATSGGRPTAC